MSRFFLHYSLAAILALSASVLLVKQANNFGHWALLLPAYMVAFAGYLVSAALIYLSLLPVSDLHTPLTAFAHFLLLIYFRLFGWYSWQKIDKMTKAPKFYQEQLLKHILQENANTEYGRGYKFAEITNRDQFKQRVPLTKYDDYRQYIDRCADKNEQNLQTKYLINYFTVTGGTTGKSKIIPLTSEFVQAYTRFGYLPYMYIIRKVHMPSVNPLAPVKTALFRCAQKPWFTKANIPIAPASSLVHEKGGFLVSLNRASPSNVIVFMNEPGQVYLFWLYALCDANLARIDGIFGGHMLSHFELLHKHWRTLVSDIKHGSLSSSAKLFGIPQNVADLVFNNSSKPHLESNPERAAFIESQCLKGFEGIVKRLWPKIDGMTCCVTGSHSVHAARLKWYCGPDVKLYTSFYSATEGTYGFNMEPNRPEELFTMLPMMVFMEFIPEANVTDDQPDTCFLEELEIEKRYELVLTSALTGFYRYRTGDVVQVVEKRHGKTPLIRFCSRVAMILDLRGEKTSDDMVSNAIKMTCKKSWHKFGWLIDFTTTLSVTWAAISTNDKESALGGNSYVVFVEFSDSARQLTNDEVMEFDKAMSTINPGYSSLRQRGSIDAPKAFALKRGAFELLKQALLKKNNAVVSNQYKTPKYLTSQDMVRLLYNEQLS